MTLGIDTMISLVVLLATGILGFAKVRNMALDNSTRISDLEEDLDSVRQSISIIVKEQLQLLDDRIQHQLNSILERLEKLEKNLVKITDKLEIDFKNKMELISTELNSKVNTVFAKLDAHKDTISDIDKNLNGMNTKLTSLDEAFKHIQSNSEVFHEYKVIKAELTRIVKEIDAIEARIERILFELIKEDKDKK